jgi:hypothetical protein
MEAIVTGQQSLLAVDEHIEQLAAHYARLIIGKQLTVAVHHNPPGEPLQYEPITIDSISNSTSRTDLTESQLWSLYVTLTNSVMPIKNLIDLFLLKIIVGCGKVGLNRLLRGINELYR